MTRSARRVSVALLLVFGLARGSAAMATAVSADSTGAVDGQAAPADQTVFVGDESTPLRLTGTLQTYDQDQRAIAVTTPSGKVRVAMTPGTRIRQGHQSLDAATLRARIGARVIVRYLESDRGPVALSLTVAGRPTSAPH